MRLPFASNTEDVQLRVIAEQRDVFVNSLGCDHAVNRVFVVAGQQTGTEGMFRSDGKQLVARCCNSRDEVNGQSASKIQFADTVFCRDLPRCGCGDEDFVLR